MSEHDCVQAVREDCTAKRKQVGSDRNRVGLRVILLCGCGACIDLDQIRARRLREPAEEEPAEEGILSGVAMFFAQTEKSTEREERLVRRASIGD